MADEQTEVLRQILDLQKQQFAFAKAQREEVMAIQRVAVARQATSLKLARFAMLILSVAVAIFIAMFALGTRAKDQAANHGAAEAADH